MRETEANVLSFAQGTRLLEKFRELVGGLDGRAAEWLLGNMEMLRMLARMRSRNGLIVHPDSYKHSRYEIKPGKSRAQTLQKANMLMWPKEHVEEDDCYLFPGKYEGPSQVRLQMSTFLSGLGMGTARRVTDDLRGFGLTTHAVVDQMIAYALCWTPEQWLGSYEPCRIIGLGTSIFPRGSSEPIVPVLLSPGFKSGRGERDMNRWRLDYALASRDLLTEGDVTWFMTAHPVEES